MCIRDSIGLKDFRGDLIRAFQAEGFIYHSEVCIWKDPVTACLLYTSDAADERSSVDLGGRRIIKKKNNSITAVRPNLSTKYHRIVHHNISADS